MNSIVDIEASLIDSPPQRRGLAWLCTSMGLMSMVMLNIYMFIPDMPAWLIFILMLLSMYIGRYSNFEIESRDPPMSMSNLRMIGSGIFTRGDYDPSTTAVTTEYEDPLARELQLTEEDINALPIHRFTKDSEKPGRIQQSQNDEGEFLCCIWLNTVVEGEIIKTLPCKHQFHARCITPWLRKKGTCPFCKFRILPAELIAQIGTTSLNV